MMRVAAGDLKSPDQVRLATSAISYQSDQSPDNLRALTQSINLIRNSTDANVSKPAGEFFDVLSRNTLVRHNGRVFALSDLDPRTQSDIIQDGVYERSTQTEVSTNVIEQSVDNEIILIEKRIEEAKGQKKDTVELKRSLKLLQLYKNYPGEARGFVAIAALKSTGDQALGEILAAHAGK